MKYGTFILLFMLATSCETSIEKTHPTIEVISESVYASGVIKSRNQYQVYATVNGVISEMLVTEGDIVKRGDPLMKVLNETSKLNAENAKLAAEHADLKSNSGKLKEAKVAIDLALSKMKNDSVLFVRQRNLKAQGVGSLVDLEQRELAYKNSVTNYEVARLSYNDLKRDLTFSATQSKTNLKISNALVDDYLIRAETDGKVYKVLKEKGEYANTLSPVAIIGDANAFLIELNVDEYDIARIRVGQPVLFTMDSYKGEVFEAKVEKIEPLMNEESKSFTVKASFLTKPALLYPNLSLEANIIIRTKEKALTIPRSYLIGDSLVLVGKDKTRKVIIGIKDYKKVEVKSGLTEKDIIYKLAQ
jgi:HlyD family secretion protein